MDFVDKENIVAAEVGQDSGQVAGAFDSGSGGCFNVNAYLGGNDMRQTGLAEAGRPVKQDMVDRLTPAFSRGNSYLEVFLGLLLSDKVGQVPGSKTRIERGVLLGRFTRYNACYFASPPLSFCSRTLTGNPGGVILPYL